MKNEWQNNRCSVIKTNNDKITKQTDRPPAVHKRIRSNNEYTRMIQYFTETIYSSRQFQFNGSRLRHSKTRRARSYFLNDRSKAIVVSMKIAKRPTVFHPSDSRGLTCISEALLEIRSDSRCCGV